ncbi:MAG: hypothetical protein PHO28_01815 [Candidatus Pacebacteria bacterium]|nr:hypothetical protein [Candidatus Paceibacterota bacterium]
MINKLNNNLYDAKGSLWRKWDLHVHPPGTKQNDGYKIGDNNEDVWNKFCEKIEQSDVLVFGITDYFSADGYKNFIEKYESKYPKSKKRFFLNIELKLNESVNRQLEEVNIHLIFNSSVVSKVDKFLNELKVVKTGKDQVPIKCSELKTKQDYESATTTRNYLKEAFKNTFGEAIQRECFLVFTAANDDGIRPKSGAKRKEAISDEIDKFSDGFFGGVQNQKYFLKTNRLEEKELFIGKKPVISGSDAHSFDDMDKFLGRRFIKKSADGNEIIIKDVTWVKADPTFEGLRQILYEPEPGDRVWIGPDVPDRKENYQIIKKIKFSNTSDFPEEIEFNQNLCSIIGGRSSGKSALLNYITHAIDPELVEKGLEIKSAGEGEEYRWEEIKINYEVEWQDGFISKRESKNSRKILYLPQNYLFKESKDPDEIKRKIEPILFKKFPEFERQYKNSIKEIEDLNKKIIDLIEKWFQLMDSIIKLEERNKALGDKKAIEEEKQKIERKIDGYKEKYSLSEIELEKYQYIRNRETELKSKINKNEEELELIQSVLGEEGAFQDLKLELDPTLDLLPREFTEKINNELNKNKKDVLENVNKTACKYKENLVKNIRESEDELKKTLDDNKSLLDKYKKNEELEELITKVNEYKETLRIINNNENEIELRTKELGGIETKVKQFSQNRNNIIESLKDSINSLNQENLDIKFGVEYQIREEDISRVSEKVNVKEKTSFVQNYQLQIEFIRENPGQLLRSIYFGDQKINSGYKKEEVAFELLTLTETILFVGIMEGDHIGGFSETTMTPGRRALFLLRLILAESDEKWPILIDQPEDNLDSKSITKEIVPFLREKKKDRQIIMVSHNANFVIGADSEQIIVANRNGNESQNQDGKQFNYLTGSIEYTKEKDESIKDTLRSQGIREHACLILDGGRDAFEHRRNKYNIVS